MRERLYISFHFSSTDQPGRRTSPYRHSYRRMSLQAPVGIAPHMQTGGQRVEQTQQPGLAPLLQCRTQARQRDLAWDTCTVLGWKQANSFAQSYGQVQENGRLYGQHGWLQNIAGRRKDANKDLDCLRKVRFCRGTAARKVPCWRGIPTTDLFFSHEVLSMLSSIIKHPYCRFILPCASSSQIRFP